MILRLRLSATPEEFEPCEWLRDLPECFDAGEPLLDLFAGDEPLPECLETGVPLPDLECFECLDSREPLRDLFECFEVAEPDLDLEPLLERADPLPEREPDGLRDFLEPD